MKRMLFQTDHFLGDHVWVTWKTEKPRTQPGERWPNAQSKDSYPARRGLLGRVARTYPQGEGQFASAGGGEGRTKGTGWEFDAGITAKMKSDSRWEGEGNLVTSV